MLLVHGDMDAECRHRPQSEKMDDALRAAGRSSELLTLQGPRSPARRQRCPGRDADPDRRSCSTGRSASRQTKKGGPCGAALRSFRAELGSARIEFDDQVRLHPHRIGHFVERRHAGEGRPWRCRRERHNRARRARRGSALRSPAPFPAPSGRARSTSPTSTRREAMLHFTPLTRMWPWLTSWRAAQIVGANLAR